MLVRAVLVHRQTTTAYIRYFSLFIRANCLCCRRTVVAWRRYACKDNCREYQSEIGHTSRRTAISMVCAHRHRTCTIKKGNQKVIYHLHPTFPKKDVVKTNESEGFMLKAQGWGEFIITFELVLYDNRRLVVEHHLSLFSNNRKMATVRTFFKKDFS